MTLAKCNIKLELIKVYFVCVQLWLPDDNSLWYSKMFRHHLILTFSVALSRSSLPVFLPPSSLPRTLAGPITRFRSHFFFTFPSCSDVVLRNDNSFGVNNDIKISLLLKPIDFACSGHKSSNDIVPFHFMSACIYTYVRYVCFCVSYIWFYIRLFWLQNDINRAHFNLASVLHCIWERMVTDSAHKPSQNGDEMLHIHLFFFVDCFHQEIITIITFLIPYTTFAQKLERQTIFMCATSYHGTLQNNSVSIYRSISHTKHSNSTNLSNSFYEFILLFHLFYVWSRLLVSLIELKFLRFRIANSQRTSKL